MNQQTVYNRAKKTIFPILAVTLQKSWWCLTDATDIKTDIFLAQKKSVEKSDRWEKSFLKGRHFTVWISFMHSKTKDMYFSVGVVTQWCYRRG